MAPGRVVAMIVRLWLVRHGSTEWSEAHRYTGHTDLPLTLRGKAEARALAWLARRSWAGVWTSDLRRARATAVLAGLDAVPDERLREIDLGGLEGKTWDELPDAVQSALLGFDDFEAPGGESTAQLSERVEAFLDGLSEGDHLVFTHGGVVRMLLRAEGGDTGFAPGSVAILEIDGSRRKRLDLPGVDNDN